MVDTPAKTNKAVLKEADMDKVTKTTAQLLNEQPKVKIKLHLDPQEKRKLEAQEVAGRKPQWPFTTVQINGHTYQIQFGKEVEVPESVVEILKQADMI